MNLSEAMAQVHQRWQRHEPFALAGTARQVFDFVKLCVTVPYPPLGKSDERETADEHSN